MIYYEYERGRRIAIPKFKEIRPGVRQRPLDGYYVWDLPHGISFIGTIKNWVRFKNAWDGNDQG